MIATMTISQNWKKIKKIKIELHTQQFVVFLYIQLKLQSNQNCT
jgi:hypothetical protein